MSFLLDDSVVTACFISSRRTVLLLNWLAKFYAVTPPSRFAFELHLCDINDRMQRSVAKL